VIQLALRYHPDKNPDNPEATEKVRMLAKYNKFIHVIYLIYAELHQIYDFNERIFCRTVLSNGESFSLPCLSHAINMCDCVWT